jgi:EmrB/QacA subfamily drug resistance transporter
MLPIMLSIVRIRSTGTGKPPPGRPARASMALVGGSSSRSPSPRSGSSSAAIAEDPDGAGEANPRRWHVLWVTQVAAFMALLDVSIVNVALPSIQRDLGASVATIQWVVSGYSLTFGLALVPAGRLGDALGRRRMYLIALAAFVVTSGLSGAAPSAQLLVAARLLQGAAGGMLTPQNTGLIQELFRGAERGRAFGILGATVGLSTAAGPVIGGLILTAFAGPAGWRWVFFVNVPIGLIALLLAARLVPPTARGGLRGLRPDVVGALLLAGGVFCVLLPLVEAEAGGLRRLWWLFVLAALLLTVFLRWEVRTARRRGRPLLDPRLARTPGYAAGATIALAYFMGFTGVWLIFALYFQHGLGYSPLRSGLAVTPFALGLAASAVVAGRLVARLGRWLTVFGVAGVATGLAIAAVVLDHVHDPHLAAWAAAGPLLFGGLGAGMVTSPNTTLTLAAVPSRMAGAAGGALQTVQRIGSAMGTALLVSVFYQVLANSRQDARAAVFGALLSASGLMLVALGLAVWDLVRQGPARALRPAPVTRPEHHHHHL